MKELWKIKCKSDLYNLRKNEAAVINLPEEIELERERMVSIKSASTGTAPVQGGGCKFEDRMNNSICLIDSLTENLGFAEREVELTRKALNMLSKDERRILEVLYIDRQKQGVERLCEELGIADHTTIRKKAAKALENYCAFKYGVNAI